MVTGPTMAPVTHFESALGTIGSFGPITVDDYWEQVVA
jgi:hypothetical protein